MSVTNPLPYTLLSLPRYAAIMGINPVHFQGAFGQTIFPIRNANCQDPWPRYPWQRADHISHQDLAYAIESAEHDIAQIIGYYPGPRWVSKEMHRWPQFYRPTHKRSQGLNVAGDRIAIETRWTKFILGGPRAVAQVGDSVAVAYTDEDGDGFAETATITVATALTDACEIDAYVEDKGGDQRWKIRSPRSKTITGGNVVLVYDSWLLLDPELQGAYPTDAGYSALDIATSSNFLSNVDVYREYTDTTDTAAQFSWEPERLGSNAVGLPFGSNSCTVCSGSGCPACSITTQDGCLHVLDTEAGLVVPTPAEYDSDNSQWDQKAFTVCRDPDQVKLWYYAGEVSESFLRGDSCETLSDFWAQTIAWLATARLEREFCDCCNVNSLTNRLMKDIAFTGDDTAFLVNFDILANPFGTRIGEVMAWKRVSQMRKRQLKAVVL